MSTELIIILIFVILNIIVFGMYGWDKRKAVKGSWRTPERTLLIGALIAPWGALLGMKRFHHKTQKTKFKLVYVFVVLHIVLAAILIYRFM